MRFRFRTIPLLATLLLVCLGIGLGNWQTRRAEEKTALRARLQARAAQAPLALDGGDIEPAAVEYRRVVAAGSFLPDWTVFLDNRPLDGRSGFVVVTPLRLDGSERVVLVERGWVPRDPAAHERVAAPPAPAGRQTITGVAVLHPARVMDLGSPPPPAPGAIVQNLDVAGFARASGLPVLPLLIEQGGQAEPGLTRKWPGPAIDVDRHKGYAFQWYALAAMACLFYLITGFRRARKQA